MARNNKIKITHIINGLSTGGAETMLLKLLSHMNREKYEAEVIALTTIGAVGERIRKLDISVRALEMPRGIPDVRGVMRLSQWLHSHPPDLVQTWMYHADLVGGIVGRVINHIPTVWNLRGGELDYFSHNKLTLLTIKSCAFLSSRLPKQIISCSTVGKGFHVRLGYDSQKIEIIPNGFDLLKFQPDEVSRVALRQELGVPSNTSLIGLVARFDPLKDHQNFIEAVGILHKSLPDVHFVLCGDGIDSTNEELSRWIAAINATEKIHLMGRREDLPRINAGLDLATLTSFSEGFPNVLGEAMACGIPCVATDVGDASIIIGDTGIIVPPKNPQTLAAGWLEILSMEPEKKAQLGLAARRRIEDNFSLPAIVARYEKLYEKILEN